MTLTIALEGIDGSGKTSIIRFLSLKKATPLNDFVCISLTDSANSTLPLIKYVGKRTKGLQRLCKRYNFKLLEGLGYLLNYILYRVSKLLATKHRIVISDRDISITHLVYAGAVSKQFEKFSDRNLNNFRLYPDVLIYLKTDADISYQRVKGKKYRQNHERPRVLKRLSKRYETVIKKLRKTESLQIVEIDTNNKNLKEVCKQVAKEIIKISLNARA